MKNYTITVNGNVYDVVVEEGKTNGVTMAAAPAAPAAAPKAAPAPKAAAAPAGAQAGKARPAPAGGRCRCDRSPRNACCAPGEAAPIHLAGRACARGRCRRPPPGAAAPGRSPG